MVINRAPSGGVIIMLTKQAVHVMFVPSWYPAYPGDTSGCFFREQALVLRQYDVNVGVITPALRSLTSGYSAWAGPFGIREELDEGMPTLRYHGVKMFSWHHALNMHFWEFTGLRIFERYRARHGMPDMLHVHGTIFGLAWAVAIHRRHGLPFVVTEHSTEFALGAVHPRLLRYLTTAIQSADRCFGVSRELRARLAAQIPLNGERIWEVMHNLVSSNFAKPVTPVHTRPARSAFTFLNVATLSLKKGQHHLLKAFAQVTQDPSLALRLRIAGGGTEEEALRRLVQELGISDRVTFLGNCSRAQIVEEMSACDAFVLSSSYETFGIVVTEALMSGKPVIATRCGGPEDIVVPDEDGFLVGKDNPEALADAMLRMCAQYDRFDAQAIQQRCASRFSERVFARRHAEVYSSVVSQVRSGAL